MKTPECYRKDEPHTIQAMFGSIATQYDKTNAILSFQLHRRWNRRLVQTVITDKPESILDLCAGTGEIAFEALQACETLKHAYLLDFCPEMLECAKYKADSLALADRDIQYITGDAQTIALQNSSVDCITIAYGIRNVKEPALCIHDAYRVLKPGGKFGILELTEPSNFLLRKGHLFYLQTILPRLGKFITNNEAAYQYLCNSIQLFIKPLTIQKMLHASGFYNVKTIPLMGGIATIMVGQK